MTFFFPYDLIARGKKGGGRGGPSLNVILVIWLSDSGETQSWTWHQCIISDLCYDMTSKVNWDVICSELLFTFTFQGRPTKVWHSREETAVWASWGVVRWQEKKKNLVNDNIIIFYCSPSWSCIRSVACNPYSDGPVSVDMNQTETLRWLEIVSQRVKTAYKCARASIAWHKHGGRFWILRMRKCRSCWVAFFFAIFILFFAHKLKSSQWIFPTFGLFD